MGASDCPLCGTEAKVISSREEQSRDIRGFECQRCARFSITLEAQTVVGATPGRWIASAEARTRDVRNALPPLFVDSPEAEGFSMPGRATMCLPRLCAGDPGIRSRLDRSLINLSFVIGTPGRSFEIHSERDRALLWSNDNEFVRFVIDSLAAEGLAINDSNPVRLSTKGWLRAEELRGGMARSGRKAQAFVAMWFAPEMRAAYAEAIEPAIREAGYEPLRVDLTEHNQKVDDEIIAQLRASAFVVADFTGQRQSVYYEAGFAHGLNRPVIFCVRADQGKDVHFDTRQYSRIEWSTEAELKIRLLNRILATVGRGQ